MKMKKITSILLAGVMSAALLAGCGSKEESSSAASAASEAAEAVSEAVSEAEETAEETPEESAPAETETVSEAEQTAPAEAVTLKVGMMGTAIKPVGTILASYLGYFEEEGVNVEFEKVSSMNDAYLAVSKGDLDVYLLSSTAAATFITQGTTTLRVFGGTAAEGSEIMAARGTPAITGADDLVGKKIGVFMAETGQMVLKDYLLQNGYTIGGEDQDVDVTFIYYSDDQSGLEAAKNGEYDYVITNSAKGYFADDLDMDVVGTVKQFVDPYPCCRQTCYQGTYENNFDALVAFERATMRGYQYYKNNMEGTLDILEEYTEGQDREFLKAQIYGTDTYTPVMRLSLDPDKKACIAFYEALENIGEIENAVDVDWDTYVVTDVFKTALDEMAEREPDEQLWKDMQAYFAEHD